MKSKFLLSALFMGIFMVAAAQTTINVPEDYETIQEAINAASDGDIVQVSPGTYIENINFDGKSITVRSYYDPEQPDSSYIFNTVIDGSQPLDPDLASVVSFGNSSDTSSVLSGFTIRNGYGTKMASWRRGGGIIIRNGGAKIIHNRIINNSIDQDFGAAGGGVYVFGNGYLPFLVLKENVICNNYVHNSEGYPGGAFGGGIYSGYVNLILENNVIDSNIVEGRTYGCGLYIYNCNGLIQNNIIAYNSGSNQVSSYSRGAGIYIQDYHSGLQLTGNLIENNEFTEGYTLGGGISILTNDGFENNEVLIDKNIIRCNYANRGGGGIYLEAVIRATVSNNAIIANSASTMGGGIYLSDDAKETGAAGGQNSFAYVDSGLKASGSTMPVLANNTIIANSSPNLGRSIACNMVDAEFLAFNNIIQDSSTAQGGSVYLSSNCHANIYYNNIDEDKIGGSGTWQGNNNIFENPEFMDDSCHIPSWSSCVDAGIDSLEVEGVFYYAPERDFEDEPRPNTGCILVDIGADESIYCPHFNAIPDPEKDRTILSLRTYPNPFTTSTTLSYTLDSPENIRFTVYNVQSQIVFVKQERQEKGEQQLQWNAEGLPAGMYYFRIKAGDKVGGGKIIKISDI